MKKILLSIVGILSIFGFCFGDNQCVNFPYSGTTSSSAVNTFGLAFKLNTNGIYTFNSFSVLGNFSYTNSLTLCYGESFYLDDSFSWSDLSSKSDVICSSVPFTSNFSAGITTFTFNSPFEIPAGYSYFYIYYNNRYTTQNFINMSSENFLDSSLIFYTHFKNNTSNNFGRSNVLNNICYSLFISSPKFKVNYGNTFYEYELEDNLEIHLKSPVSMSGSYNYIYDGFTGINLFYNNTSDFYNKDKLYLKSMYWYNKNIFTPICL